MDMTTNLDHGAGRERRYCAFGTSAGLGATAFASGSVLPRIVTVAHAETNAIFRAVMVFLGVVLCLAAFGLWLVPEAIAEAQVIRAGLTFLFVGGGFALYRQGRDDRLMQVYELDPVSDELRQIEISPGGMRRCIKTVNLAGAEITPRRDGKVLLSAPETGQSLLLHRSEIEALLDGH